MKLTEKQLAHIFRQSKNSDIESDTANLFEFSAASDKRLAEVEKIANNSTLSASYQLTNELKSWSNSLSKDIKHLSQPKWRINLTSWLKPTLATAAMATAVYFLVPTMNQEIHRPIQSDSMMFTGSFEKSMVKKTSIKKKQPAKSDTIYKSTFS
jgi:exopolysaccharide biosynthesis protein